MYVFQIEGLKNPRKKPRTYQLLREDTERNEHEEFSIFSIFFFIDVRDIEY